MIKLFAVEIERVMRTVNEPIPTMAIGSGHSEGLGSFPKTLVVDGKPGIVWI